MSENAEQPRRRRPTTQRVLPNFLLPKSSEPKSTREKQFIATLKAKVATLEKQFVNNDRYLAEDVEQALKRHRSRYKVS